MTRTQQPLHVSDALSDPLWRHNPDIALAMIAYYGVPINWPDGRIFGTFCMLLKREKITTQAEQTLIRQCA